SVTTSGRRKRMTRYTLAILGTAILCTVAATRSTAQQKQAPAAARPNIAVRTAALPPVANLMPAESQSALLKQYCSGCHNDNTKSGGMTLTKLDLTHVEQTPELAEKMIKKLRAG